MIVSVGSDGTNILEGDDLQRLSVQRRDDSPLDGLLAGLGRVDPDDAHAWLTIEALRAAVDPGEKTPGWDSRFEAMVDYAASKGWVDPGPGSLRAHIESGIGGVPS
jgi:hypothetical protein